MATTSYTFAALLTELDTNIGDGTDFTFTNAEKTAALTDAFNDEYVGKITRDTSLTTGSQQQAYTLPDAISYPTDVFIDVLGDGYGEKVDQNAWDVIDGSLRFTLSHKYILPSKTIILYGWQKFDTDDSIPHTLKNYVLALATRNLITQLMMKKTFRFIKNDTTMAEIVAAKNDAENIILQFRGQARNTRIVDF